MSNDTFVVKKSAAPIALNAGWDSALWSGANETAIRFAFANNSDYTPDVRVRMLYDDKRICGLYQVKDRYVVARAKHNQDQVCQDSCVEFFVRPAGADCYFNFEMNCGGTILLYHVKGMRCTHGNYDLVPEDDLATIERFHTMPAYIDPEMVGDVTWYLGFGIPIAFFEKYCGIDPKLSGQSWKANFNKCADKCSHPTWLSWQPLDKLNFHMPEQFGNLIFE